MDRFVRGRWYWPTIIAGVLLGTVLLTWGR